MGCIDLAQARESVSEPMAPPANPKFHTVCVSVIGVVVDFNSCGGLIVACTHRHAKPATAESEDGFGLPTHRLMRSRPGLRVYVGGGPAVKARLIGIMIVPFQRPVTCVAGHQRVLAFPQQVGIASWRRGNAAGLRVESRPFHRIRLHPRASSRKKIHRFSANNAWRRRRRPARAGRARSGWSCPSARSSRRRSLRPARRDVGDAFRLQAADEQVGCLHGVVPPVRVRIRLGMFVVPRLCVCRPVSVMRHDLQVPGPCAVFPGARGLSVCGR